MNSMNRLIASGSFRRLVASLEKSSPSPALPTSPYPWPDEEMIARYDMRYLTPEERTIFPTHRLVLNVFKAKVTKIAKSPYINPEAGNGWIVWTVESYPGSHQFRMLNGDLLHEQYHGIEWDHVSDETAVTTPDLEKRFKAQRQWQRNIRFSIQQNLQL